MEMGKQVRAEIGEDSMRGKQFWHGKGQLLEAWKKVAEKVRQKLIKNIC